MSKLSNSWSVPTIMSSHARKLANRNFNQQLNQTPPKDRIQLCSSLPNTVCRPVSDSPFKNFTSSFSTPEKISNRVTMDRKERMEEIAILTARRRVKFLDNRRSVSFSCSSHQYSKIQKLELSDDPTQWTSQQVAQHLSSVLGLVSKALMSDVRRWTCSEGLDGISFLSLSDQDLYRMGMSIGWTKVIIKSRDDLRSRCHWETSRNLSTRCDTGKDKSDDESESRRRLTRRGPSSWTELVSFIILTSLGITLIVGKVFSIKVLMFVRKKSKFFGLSF
ncbi:expressed protein [Phakopsora pachyrhizi]|uniref:Expressed protein n=1 Tax=Phakopsora pachyrhizi TaxID=170000 RepID=A0AAV0AED5_PHAPC|nr:expressed protein [Phakopsora pachyrhizi]